MAIHFLNADGSLKSIEHKGLVLEVRKGVNYRIMSDVWGSADEALVWDKANKRPKTINIRVCDYTWDSNSYAEVDATKAVKAAYRNHLIQIRFSQLKSQTLAAISEIQKGCMVEVVKGRKVPKGTKGKVVVMMTRESGWGYRSSPALKLGVATSDVMVDVTVNGRTYRNHRDMVWVWAYNCKRIDVPVIDEEELMRKAIVSVDYSLKQKQAA